MLSLHRVSERLKHSEISREYRIQNNLELDAPLPENAPNEVKEAEKVLREIYEEEKQIGESAGWLD